MILLDTNVVSELIKPIPNVDVVAWVRVQSATRLFISTISEAELRYGVALLPHGRRRDKLAEAVDAMLTHDFAGRILPFDRKAAAGYASIASRRRQVGREMSQLDAQIAGIAKAWNASVATRNGSDFQGCGVEIIDPWNLPR